MKSNILLVAQGASSSNRVIADAAVEAGRGLRHASSSQEAFEILADDVDNIDLVIIDVDPGINSLAVLETPAIAKPLHQSLLSPGLKKWTWRRWPIGMGRRRASANRLPRSN
jgi:hypothetical protein